MSKIGSIVGSSFMSILPGASAASVAYEVDAIEKYTKENCPELADIGGLAGNFCEAYIISDMDTIDEDPAKFISDLYAHGDFVDDSGEDNEMPRIAKDSGLAKYIVYCGQRESGFGTADFNIANSIETLGSSADPSAGSNADDNNSAFSQAADIVIDAAVGSIPLVGDGLDIWGSDKIRRNIGYVDGRVCITKHLDEGEDGDLTEDWEYNSKYQRFVQDSLAAGKVSTPIQWLPTSPGLKPRSFHFVFIPAITSFVSIPILSGTMVSLFIKAISMSHWLFLAVLTVSDILIFET